MTPADVNTIKGAGAVGKRARVKAGPPWRPCVGAVGVVERVREDGWLVLRLPDLAGAGGAVIPFRLGYQADELEVLDS